MLLFILGPLFAVKRNWIKKKYGKIWACRGSGGHDMRFLKCFKHIGTRSLIMWTNKFYCLLAHRYILFRHETFVPSISVDGVFGNYVCRIGTYGKMIGHINDRNMCWFTFLAYQAEITTTATKKKLPWIYTNWKLNDIFWYDVSFLEKL